jgi:hypothetical protein
MTTQVKTDARFKQAPRLAQRRIGEDLFVVDPGTKCLHQPVDAGEFLWEKLSAAASAAELAGLLRDEYEVDEATARKDVRRFLRELLRKKLIVEERP